MKHKIEKGHIIMNTFEGNGTRYVVKVEDVTPRLVVMSYQFSEVRNDTVVSSNYSKRFYPNNKETEKMFSDMMDEILSTNSQN